MLTKEQKEQWLKDLRSGDFKQTTGMLYRESTNGYCCLGVLSTQFTGKKLDKATSFRNINGLLSLPESVLSQPVRCILISMNDRQGKSFKEIADFIEKEV